MTSGTQGSTAGAAAAVAGSGEARALAPAETRGMSGVRIAHILLAAASFLVSLVVYYLTLNKTVPFWDSGEYIATSYILGVPHPPGTPLYVLLGRVFSMVPISTVAVRVNLLCALPSALAVLLTYLVTVRIVRRFRPDAGESGIEAWLPMLAGIVAAFFTAFSYTFWESAVEAEVYPLSSFMMIFAVWLILNWWDGQGKGANESELVLIAYLVSMSVGFHLGTVLIAPAVVLLVFLVRPSALKDFDHLVWAAVTLSMCAGISPLSLALAPLCLALTLLYSAVSGRFRSMAFWTSVLFILGISTHAFLYLRAKLDPAINEGDPSTLRDLWLVLIRDQYKPGSIFDRKADFAFQLNMYWGYMKDQFAWGRTEIARVAPILLGVFGLWAHAAREKKSFLMLFANFLIMSLGLIIYLNFKVDEVRPRDYFYTGSFTFYAIWMGMGAAWLLAQFHAFARSAIRGPGARPATAAVAAGLVVLSILPARHAYWYHDRTGNWIAHDYARNMLVSCEKDAILFTNGDNDTFPLWYIQEVEGFRKDVRIVNLSLLNTFWYIKQLRDYEPRVPIVWTDPQIDSLRPIRDQQGNIHLIKDLAVDHIVEQNRWQRPLYIAVTVPDHMGYEPQLVMEGLVFRMVPEPTQDQVDIEKTLENLRKVYSYRGYLNADGSVDTTIYRDENATKLLQNYGAAYTQVGRELRREGKYDEALECLLTAKRMMPAFAGIALEIGFVYEDMRDWEKAEEHYREMVRYFDAYFQVHEKLAEILATRGKYDEAVVEFLRVIQMNPDLKQPYYNLVSVYNRQGREDLALEILQDWVRIHPEDAEAQRYLAAKRDSLARVSAGAPRAGGTAVGGAPGAR